MESEYWLGNISQFVCVFMSRVWLNVCVCVCVHVQGLDERVLHVCLFLWMFMSSVWLNVFFMCVFDQGWRTCTS